MDDKELATFLEMLKLAIQDWTVKKEQNKALFDKPITSSESETKH